MSLSNQLLHQIADQTISHNERAWLRCQLAKQLEEVGNYEAAREAMGELWQGVDHRPVLNGLDQVTAAEVLLRAGVLTGWIGSSRQIEGAQEKAKNLISESITIFEALGDTEKIAEAQMEIGYCYWREGAFNEARDLLHEALRRLADSHSEVKAITLLRLALVERTSLKLNDALRLHMQAAPLFEASSNHTIKGRFHNEYAQVLRKLGSAEGRTDYIDRALIEYAASSYHFEQSGHMRYQACVENNLGFLFGTIKRFREAHEHLDRAQALFTRLRDKVHIAQVDETRARVLLEERRIAEAEKFARGAVCTLETGGEQSLYAEALITHGMVLARLGRYQQAHLTLQNAVIVAQNAGDTESAGQANLTIIEELGEQLTTHDLGHTFEQALDFLSASKHPTNKDRLLSCARRVLFLIGVLPSPLSWENFSLAEALRRYEGHIIERALKDANGIVTRAAHLLGFKHHSSLINRLNSRHRELLSARTPIEPRKRSLVFVRDTEARSLSILHVEDNKLVASAVKESLEMEGWTVESLGEGTAVLKMIAGDTNYDVLIFDDELPDTNGIELIRQTRRLIHRQQTPIIMFSANDVEKEARRAGANAFLRKPEGLTSIAETIAQLLARKPKPVD
jgi:CheY-like chemotaxis protein/tetratricopeptide (TPR) repeat protein